MERHGGRWLKRQVELLGTHEAFAKALGIPAVTLRSWFAQSSPKPRPHRMAKLAKELKMAVATLEKELVGDADPMLLAENQNIEPYSEVALVEVPMFELSIACGDWADVSDVPVVTDKLQIQQGLFRVRLRGNSMAPKFKEGEVVEFKLLRPHCDQVEIGAAYYVQRSDGMATFKLVMEYGEERLTLAAINKKDHPEPMYIECSELTRLAKAVGKFQPI